MTKLSPTAHNALVAERKTQILEAAAKVFAAKGFERATISEIAKEAGMAEGSIYNYFKNKSELLIGLPRQIIEIPVATLAQIANAGSPEETLMMMARTMMGAITKNVHIFRILFTSIPHMNKKIRQQYVDDVILYGVRALGAFFEQQIHRGVFRSDLDPQFLALAFIGMFFPTLLLPNVLQVEVPFPIDNEQIIATCVRVFLNGALAAPTPSQARPRGLVPVE